MPLTGLSGSGEASFTANLGRRGKEVPAEVTGNNFQRINSAVTEFFRAGGWDLSHLSCLAWIESFTGPQTVKERNISLIRVKGLLPIFHVYDINVHLLPQVLRSSHLT
jgi:hypothetical protein